VTEQRASTDKINRMARFDTLTGLPNRLLVNEAWPMPWPRPRNGVHAALS